MDSKSTVSPPAINWFPKESLSVTVISDELDPLAIIVVGSEDIVDFARSTGPGMKLTVSLSGILSPFRIADIVDTPAVVEEVSTTV